MYKLRDCCVAPADIESNSNVTAPVATRNTR
jgi:hypothetical protein